MNIVITGGTKGIGRAIANRMAEGGHDLFLCSRNQEELQSASTEIAQKYGVKCHWHKADVGEKSDIDLLIQAIGRTWSQVDVLVNNAGTFLPGLVTEEEEGRLELMLRVNLLSAYHLTRGLLPLLHRAQRGYILNMSSVAGLHAYPNGGSYSISKFALRGWSMALREELKDSRIGVTTIVPGATWSASWAGVDLPQDRLMLAEDIAEVVDSITRLSPQTVMEEVILRPQLGDL